MDLAFLKEKIIELQVSTIKKVARKASCSGSFVYTHSEKWSVFYSLLGYKLRSPCIILAQIQNDANPREKVK